MLLKTAFKNLVFSYLLTLDDVIASRGGIPLIEGGKLIGAIGCSSGTGSQDETVCTAAANTINTTVQVAARYQTRVITRFQLERDRLGAILPRSDRSVRERGRGERQPHIVHWAVRQTQRMPSKRHVGGRRQSRQAKGVRRRLCCLSSHRRGCAF
jgi:hypothetical protein